MTAPKRAVSVSSFAKVCMIALLAAAMPLTGCASKYGKQTTVVNHYPDCYSPINELRKNEFYAQKSAAAGAVGGALLGALIGYAATGKASGALAGAAVGGIAGGAAGGIYGQHQQEQNDEARLAQYNASLDGNIREVNKATAAAKVARQCYERQFTVAASEFKAGHISREQFNSRYNEVVQGLEEAATILGEANRNSAQVAQEYSKAIDQEAQNMAQNKQPQASSGSKKAPKAQAASSGQSRQVADLRKKSSDMNASVSAGQEEERLLRQRLASTQQQAKDLLS